MVKKLLSFTMAAVLIMSLFPAVHAAETSGSYGSISWVLDDSGTLTISGEGAMDWTAPVFYIDNVKAAIIEEGITSIGQNTFANCRQLTSVVIPESVTSIGDYAFEQCTSLENVKLPSGLKSIGYNAFYCCDSLQSISIPSGVTDIGDRAFGYCSALKSVKLPDSLKSIGYDTFRGCTSLQSISIPKSVMSIGSSAFSGCTSLTKVEILDGKTEDREEYTFIDCSVLSSIGNNAFSGCTALASLNIPDSVASIGENAFYGCVGLTDVYINDLSSFLDIGVSQDDNPLYYAKNLYIDGELVRELIIPDGTETIGAYTFFGLDCLESVVIPDGVTSVGDHAFYGCYNMTDIVIPDSVTSIADYAFSGSGLTSVSLPAAVTESNEGEYMFSGCSSLESAEIRSTPDINGFRKIHEYMFYGCNNLRSIALPFISSINSSSFTDCDSLTDVYYEGSNNRNLSGANYLSHAQWHFNHTPDAGLTSSDPGNIIYVYASGGQDIVYDEEEGSYSHDSFTLDISIHALLIGDPAPAANASVTVTLPEGFSFYSDASVSSRKYAFDALASERHISETVYLQSPPVGESELTIRAVADNVPAKKYEYSFNVSSYIFELNKYRADFLLRSDTGALMENSFFGDTPGGVIYQTGRENGLETWTAAWSAFMDTLDMADSPSGLLGYTFEEKDMYTAVIMSMFESSVDSTVTSLMTNELTKQTNTLLSSAAEEMETLYNINICDTNDFSRLTDAQRGRLGELFGEAFEQKYPDIASVSRITGYVGTAMDYVGDFKTLCENVAAYYNINRLGDSMKQLMRDMYNACPDGNSALRAALGDCIEVMDSGQSAFAADMAAYTVSVVGRDAAQFCIDKFWGDVKTAFCTAHPAAFTFQAAYIGGKTVANTFFNADGIEEEYCRIAALCEVWDLIKEVYSNEKSDFASERTEEAALIYNSAIDVMFNMLGTDCDYAINYADEINDAWMQKILNAFGDTTIEDWKERVERIANGYSSMHRGVLTQWIYQLAEDDPDRYDEYSYLLDFSESELSRKLSINCPVDVYVLNKNNSVVGYVENNTPWCAGDADITIGVNGDSKTVYLYGGEYTVICVGNDTGTMDMDISEYTSDGEERTVYFYDVPLTKGLTYMAALPSEGGEYVLTDENSVNIYPDYDSSAAGETAYSAAVTQGYFTAGPSASAELTAGERAEIAAYVPNGYEFAGWVSDAGGDIFDDADSSVTTICMPSNDINITANIVERPRLSVTEIAGGRVTVEALACDGIERGTVILAVYDWESVLKSVYTKDFAETVTFDGIELTSGSVKAMLWDGIDTMRPLADGAEKAVQ